MKIRQNSVRLWRGEFWSKMAENGRKSGIFGKIAVFRVNLTFPAKNCKIGVTTQFFRGFSHFLETCMQPDNTLDIQALTDEQVKHLQTVSGRSVEIYRIGAPGPYPVHGLVEGADVPFGWTNSGVFDLNETPSEFDLVLAPEKLNVCVAAWVNSHGNKVHASLSEGPFTPFHGEEVELHLRRTFGHNKDFRLKWVEL